MSSNEFSGQEYEFAVGSMQGLRAWDVDDLGRLHGVTHRMVWLPGENVSVCQQTQTVPCAAPKVNRGSRPADPQPGRKKKRRDTVEFTVSFYGDRSCGEPSCDGRSHTVPSGHRFDPSCGCGFWAYDEGSFKAHGSIVGVIDAYGKTTIGTKGFRAEKARILALSRQDKNGDQLSRSLLFRLATLYPDVTFYDDYEALVNAHDGVLKDWPEVDEHFWIKPVAEREDRFSGWVSRVPPNGFSVGGVV